MIKTSDYIAEKTLTGAAPYIGEIISGIRENFEEDGFEVFVNTFAGECCEISITKGGVFRTFWGVKWTMTIGLASQGNDVYFIAGSAPSGEWNIVQEIFFWISSRVFDMVSAWELRDMVKYSKLADRALRIAERVVASHAGSSAGKRICVNCGQPVPESFRFCPSCGARL